MRLFYKYYRWRADKANDTADAEKFRLKAYRISRVCRRGTFVGRDLTGLPDSDAIRYDLTGDEPLRLEDAKYAVSDLTHYPPGRYDDGEDERGHTVWKETPTFWANSREANEQHVPTRNSLAARSQFSRIDPETGRRTYWRYDYKTGKQVQVK